MAACNNPEKRVAVKATCRYTVGSLAYEIACPIIVPITSEHMDTGPTAKCLELPKIEYISGGTKLESVSPKSSFILYYFTTHYNK